MCCTVRDCIYYLYIYIYIKKVKSTKTPQKILGIVYFELQILYA